MHHLLVTHGQRASTLPLAAATLIGRAPSCLVRIDDATLPAHWLEMRWRGASWSWRALSSSDRTRGTGGFLENGWRAMTSTSGRGTRIALGKVSVELISAAPPEPFVWDILEGRAIDGDALDEVAEVRGGDLLPLSAEGDATLRMRDGACWIHPSPAGDRVLRAHLPQVLTPTMGSALDLRSGPLNADLDLRRNALLLTRGETSIEVTGACVRALSPYDRTRRESDNGWLGAADAWCQWVASGGSPDAPVDAVAWERGRLRRLLDRAGVCGLDALVERRKFGNFIQTRLGPHVEMRFIR
ncbi:MAG: hypothetical protein EXR71_20990 [Myxococcales bacterium]|nr:hypothetical protein [Myxococcales bacterium]